MKLINVSRVLNISIDYNDLSKYMQALDSLINDSEGSIDNITILKQFSVELGKILKNAIDY